LAVLDVLGKHAVLLQRDDGCRADAPSATNRAMQATTNAGDGL
jgi:hypothetical protein